MDEYVAVLKKYAVFEGRARRSEYWYFVLFNVLISIGVGFFNDILGIVYNLAVCIPAVAVAVRRLHDTGKSGWMLLLWFLPVIGWIWLFVLLVTDSIAGDNQYGPNPKETVLDA